MSGVFFGGEFLLVWDTPRNENFPKKKRWKNYFSSQLVPFFRRYLLFVCNRIVGIMLPLGISFHMQLKRFLKKRTLKLSSLKKGYQILKKSYLWTKPVFFFGWCVCVWLVGKPSKRSGSENGENPSFLVKKVGWGGPFFYSPSSAQKRDKLVTSDTIFLGDLGTRSFFGASFLQGKMELGSLMFSRTANICDKSVRIKKTPPSLAPVGWPLVCFSPEKSGPRNSLCQVTHQNILGGGFKYFSCSPLPGEDEPILTNIFQLGWFNHQLELFEESCILKAPQVTFKTDPSTLRLGLLTLGCSPKLADLSFRGCFFWVISEEGDLVVITPLHGLQNG